VYRVNIIPSKSIFDRETYEGFILILVAFSEYLGEEIFEKGWSEELVRALKGKEGELLKNANMR